MVYSGVCLLGLVAILVLYNDYKYSLGYQVARVYETKGISDI